MPSRDILAVIPARGGSKGIPRKNLVEFAGEPLVVHSIRHALESAEVTRVIVSTDDDEIARVARDAGAEVPFLRPAELATDQVLDWPVFDHSLAWLRAHEDYQPEYVVHLRPTAPHRRPGWIDEALRALRRHPEADSIRSVSPPSQHPYRVFSIGADGFLAPIMSHEHPEPYVLRRQDLPKMYYYNCVVDAARTDTIIAKRSMTGSRILPYIMDPDDVIDIDSARDLVIARTLFGGEG